MNESQLQKNYNLPIDPGYSKIYSGKGFVNIDDGRMGGTHWCACYVKKKQIFLL